VKLRKCRNNIHIEIERKQIEELIHKQEFYESE
jgi:hypothetical protein